MELHVPIGLEGWASFNPNVKDILKNKREFHSYSPMVGRMDTFFENRNLANLSFIKIDVEGYDLNCLLGSQKTIKEFRPFVIFENLTPAILITLMQITTKFMICLVSL